MNLITYGLGGKALVMMGLGNCILRPRSAVIPYYEAKVFFEDVSAVVSMKDTPVDIEMPDTDTKQIIMMDESLDVEFQE